MHKRLSQMTDEMRLAEAMLYFVFVGAIAVGATIAAHIF